MKRRQFIETTLAGMGAVGAQLAWNVQSRAGESDTESAPFSTDPVAPVQLTPNVKTTRIGLGTGVHGSMRQCNLTRMDRTQAINMVRYCYDQGIRFFDVADMYGTHEIVRDALSDKPRDSYTLSTKVWCHPGGIPEKERPTADILVERFLKELKTDYLDMVQIHCLTSDKWLEQFGYQMEPLEKLKQRGLIRAHGVTCHALQAAQMAAAHPWVDSMHIRINSANIRMDGSWDQNVEACRTARKNGKGVIAMKILGEGAIKSAQERKRSTDAVTRLDCISTMIVGFEKPEHVDEFLTNVQETLKAMANA